MALRSRLLSACARPALASSPRVLPAALARPPSFAGATPPPHVPPLRRCLSSGVGLPLGSKPTMEDAKTMPREYYEMPNEVLLTLAANGDYGAMEERLIREIMAVDDVTWDEAQPKFKEIATEAHAGKGVATLPYKLGIAAALTAGFASIPLCFSLSVAQSFNELFVTTDVPETKDLETWLEVGSWTWNWMEPPLGQISFFILCLQFAKDRMQNIGAKPYTDYLLSSRAASLSAAYPKYNKKVVEDFAVGAWYEK